MPSDWPSHLSRLLVVAFCLSHAALVQADDGDFASSFDNDGMLLLTEPDGIVGVSSVAATQDGKLLFGGWSGENEPNPGARIAKLNADGSFDSTFGTDGILAINIGLAASPVTDIAVQNDGRILITGGAFEVANDLAVFVARYEPDGSLDLSFGNNGVVYENVFANSNSGDLGATLMLLEDGRILVGVSTNLILGFTADGQLDTDWFNNGWLAVPSDMTGGGLAADSKGRVIVAVAPVNISVNVPEIRVRRYYREGFLDSSLNNGQVLIDVKVGDDYTMDIATDVDDRIYLAGFSQTGTFSNRTYESWVVRLLSTGELDATYGVGGIADLTTPVHSSIRARGIEILPDGRAVVFAETTSGDPDDEVIVFAVDADGTVDNSFGLGGYQRADTVPSSNITFLYRWRPGIAVLPSGNIVIAPENCGCAFMLESLQWDTAPDDVEFSAFAAVPPGSDQGSVVEVSGLGDGVTVPFIAGFGEVSRNAPDDFSRYSGSAANADELTLRHQASGEFSTTVQSWLEIGGIQPKNNKQLLLGSTEVGVLQSTTMPLVNGASYASGQFFPRMKSWDLIDFEGYAPPGGSVGLGNPGTFEENGHQVNSNTNAFVIGANSYGTGAYHSTQAVFDEQLEVDIELGPGVHAIGFSYWSGAGTVIIDGDQEFDLPAAPFATLAFFGFARPLPIRSVKIVGNEYKLDVDSIYVVHDFHFPSPLLMRRQSDQRWIGYELSDSEVQGVNKLTMTRNPDYEVVARADFDGDTRPDALLRDIVGGQNGRWVLYTLESTDVLTEGFADLTRNPDWQMRAAEDFNGDGRADVLLRNAVNNRWLMYLMNGQEVLAQSVVSLPEDPGVTFKGVGDFNGDGRKDLLLRHADGSWSTYLMDGLGVTSIGAPAMTSNTDFELVAIRDFHDDGMSDILLRRSDGRWFIYLMDGHAVLDSGSPAFVESTAWSFQAAADFDGSGTDDVLIRRDDGRWYLYTLDGLSIIDEGAVDMTGNPEFEIVSVGDFSADFKSDLLMRRSDGRWVVYYLDGPTVLGQGAPDISRNMDWVPYPVQ